MAGSGGQDRRPTDCFHAGSASVVVSVQEIIEMASDPAPSDQPINQYAVVTYIPDRLGEFLNRLRKELVPGATGLAHVTVLPPRRLEVSNGEAADWIGGHIHGAHAFPIGVAEVQVFDQTDVIYAEIGTGREA